MTSRFSGRRALGAGAGVLPLSVPHAMLNHKGDPLERGDRISGTPPSVLGSGPEFDLIRRFVVGLPSDAPGVQVGPGDDCAVVTGAGIALSCDLSVEGVHFRRDWLRPDEIGYRAAAAALSDLAAVAARPLGVLTSLALPATDAGEYAEQVMLGVRRAVQEVGGTLLGGDLARAPGPLVLDVTVVGQTDAPVLRSGAQPGDQIWITGELGGAAACVAALLRGESPSPAARERFARPVPRVREAMWLADRGVVRAMLDLSDGLAGDAAHLAAASAVALLLESESIPVHAAARDVGGEAALRLAVSGGEDYELCLCAPAGAIQPLVEEFVAAFGIPLTRVGEVEVGSGVWWRRADGGRTGLGSGGFQHFGGDA